MGDMTDYYLESFDYFDDDEHEQPAASPVCRRCGSGEVHWRENRQGKWRLHDDRNCALHICTFNTDMPNLEE